MTRRNLLVISLCLLCLISFSLVIARSAYAQKVVPYASYGGLWGTMLDRVMEVGRQETHCFSIYLPIIVRDNGSSTTPVEQNIAFCKPATASGGNEASNAVDGSSNTYWSAQDFAPQWIEINLKSPATINRIQLKIDQT